MRWAISFILKVESVCSVSVEPNLDLSLFAVLGGKKKYNNWRFPISHFLTKKVHSPKERSFGEEEKPLRNYLTKEMLSEQK